MEFSFERRELGAWERYALTSIVGNQGFPRFIWPIGLPLSFLGIEVCSQFLDAAHPVAPLDPTFFLSPGFFLSSLIIPRNGARPAEAGGQRGPDLAAGPAPPHTDARPATVPRPPSPLPRQGCQP